MESLIDELHRQLDRMIRTVQTIAAVAVRGWDGPRFDNKIKRYTSTVESVQVILIKLIIIVIIIILIIIIMMIMIMIISEDMSINNEWMKQTTHNTK